MKRVLFAATAMFVLAGTPVLAQDSQTTPAATATMPAPPAQEFVNMAASSDMFEIESSKLALDMAKEAELKQFAEQMIADHTKASQELKLAVESTGDLEVPKAMDPKHQAMLDSLKSASEFDAAYTDAQVKAHEEALALLTSYAEGGDHEALKAHAAKTQPVVQMHAEMIHKMHGSM